jgi:hypothetical protein
MYHVLLAPIVNTINSFSFLNPIFNNFFEFSIKNSFKIQYLPHLKYENYEINFIKLDSTTIFEQQQVQLWIGISFLFMILLIFIKNWFNNQ